MTNEAIETAGPAIHMEPVVASVDPGGRAHVPAIDGVRGIAVLAVLLSHLTLTLDNKTHVGHFILKCLEGGWWGVDLFFVLSGFLITGILLDARGDKRYFSTFYARRVLRIFPLYYGILVVLFLVLPHVLTLTAPQQQIVSRQWWVWTYLTNVALAIHNDWTFFYSGWLGLGHYWSLAVEEHFYLAWPLLVLLCSPKRLMQVCIAMVVGALISRCWCFFYFHNSLAIYALTPCRMDSLAIGAMVTLFLRSRSSGTADPMRASVFKIATIVAVVTGLGFITLLIMRHDFSEDDAIVGTVGFCVIDWFCASVLTLAIVLPRTAILSRFFSSRILRSFGKYSYAIYLLDPYFESTYVRWFGPKVMGRLVQSQMLGILLYAIAAICCAWLIGFTSWNLYERHFLRLKRFFTYAGDGRHRKTTGSAIVIPSGGLIPGAVVAPEGAA